MKIIYLIIVLFLSINAWSEPIEFSYDNIGMVILANGLQESDYVKVWCTEAGGFIEYVLPDKTRCDCLTGQFAWEVDYANKWYEGAMQSLHYSHHTGKNPGLVLILKSVHDWKYYERALKIINERNLPIQVELIRAYGN